MAEDTLNVVQKQLGGGGECSTLEHPLMGSRDYTLDLWQTLTRQYRVPEVTARHLAENMALVLRMYWSLRRRSQVLRVHCLKDSLQFARR